MKKITVNLKDRSYPVIVGNGVLSALAVELKKLALGPDLVIVTNPLVNRLHGRRLKGMLKAGGCRVKIFCIEDSERSKSLAVAGDLIDRIIRYSVDKKIVIVAFGGGVVGDLAGFVAAVIKRGVPLVQVPTTLLAQIDSAIGGKVAVDLNSGKNLVGAFYQPRLVLSDVSFLKTLSLRQVRNGLAEAVKYGVIKDAGLFKFIEEEHRALLARDPSALARLVLRCSAIKAEVVSRDERETKGLRVILNFGHTIGHAIESASSYETFSHGEAVALGMRAAARMSCRLSGLKPVDSARLDCLLSAIGLPEKAEGVSFSSIMSAMRFDKKFSAKKNRFVMMRAIGQVKVQEGVPASLIAAQVRQIL
jgi:3-dehydroquinate synthase